MMEKMISLTKSVQTEFPEMLEQLQKYNNQLALKEVISSNLSIDGTFTLKNHKRSKFKKLDDGGFISFKGFLGEYQDYSQLLENGQNILGNKNTAQMFPIIERKIPFQCLLSELTKEYEVSLRFIEK